MEGRGGEEEEEDGRPVLLVACVWVEELADGAGDGGESRSRGRNHGGWELVVQWKRGRDVQAFEGFASHVGRKIREEASAIETAAVI